MFDSTIRNDPSRQGSLAARKRLFGDFCRFAVAPVHTRFEDAMRGLEEGIEA